MRMDALNILMPHCYKYEDSLVNIRTCMYFILQYRTVVKRDGLSKIVMKAILISFNFKHMVAFAY